MKKIYKRFIERWKSETPVLYKKIRNISGSLAATAAGVKTAIDGAGIEISPMWIKVFAYVIGISTFIALSSQLTKKKEDGE